MDVSNSRAIGVLGAGSWGTALAIALARHHQHPVLWSNEAAHAEAMQAERCNTTFLPGHRLPDSIRVTADLLEAVGAGRDVLVVVPSHAFREVLERIAAVVQHAEHRLAWATKGFEPGTGRLLSAVASEALGDHVPLAVISGPTFAGEIAAGLPAAATVASRDAQFAIDLAARFHDQHLRMYTSTDIIGVQVGGAVKNVLAIAAGVADGLGFGANTRAALITRGLAELSRLGVAMGGSAETFTGLAGLGDLVLTCTDDQSRNRRMGLALARGESVTDAERAMGQVVEGVRTAREVMRLARRYRVEMPIAEQVARLVQGECNAREAVAALLSRESKPEFD